MRLKSILVFFMILGAILLLVSCGNADETMPMDNTATQPAEDLPVETDSDHTHKYRITNIIKSTCLEEGYEVYSCECGLSYKNLIPVAHSYRSVKSTDGKYTKKQCSVCGDYKITRNQSYIYNITFDGYDQPADAVNDQKNATFYTANKADGSSGYVKINNELEEGFLYISECNFCVWDDTKTITSKKFVASMDVMFEHYADVTLNLFSVSYRDSRGRETYNDGLLKVASDGSVYVSGSSEPFSVRLKTKGYNNIAVVFDPITGLADVYINEKLERSNVKYIEMPSDISKSYIRYFDRKTGFSAQADNLKVYVADTPEFIVPDGISFPK